MNIALSSSDIAVLEAIPASAFSALLRGTDPKKKKKKKPAEDPAKESGHVYESAAVMSSTDPVTDPADNEKIIEGPKMKVWLLTEGLGNMRDKNYYGPECIQSAPAIFEGSKMLLNHPGFDDENNRPEGDVENTVAYYRNCQAEQVDTPAGRKWALTAEAHFDQTQEGLNAFQKAKTAVHFRDDFPASDKEYVAISVNAIGESEPREMSINGQTLEVNYVTRFGKESRGADMVTFAARGGSFRALIEDIYGASRPTKEAKMKKLLKALESAQTALKEAMAEKEAGVRQKKTLEAQTALDVSIKALKEASLKAEEEAGGATTITAGEEAGVQHDPENPNCECESCKPSADGAVDGDGTDGEEGSSHTITHKVVSKGKAAIAAAGKQESERRELMKAAVEKCISESGINEKYFDIPALCAMSFKEAKLDIAKQKRMHEAAVETVLSKVGQGVSASHRARESSQSHSDDGASEFAGIPMLAVAE